jgi:hypothetical protein
MPLSVASTSRNGRDPVVFTNLVARSDTTAKDLFHLKAGWIPLGLSIFAPVASNAGTSAILSIGSTGNVAYFASPIQLKSGTQSLGQSHPSSVSNLGEPLDFDTTVIGTYAESGSASTSGGPWLVSMTVIKA